MKIKLDENKINTKGITRFGRFTIAELEFTSEADNKVITGIGIAKQGNEDKYRDEIGRNIAVSRAKRAIVKKLSGKSINEVFAG